MIEAHCEKCGKIFLKYPSQLKKFCSKKCMLEARMDKTESIEFKCEECGKTFSRLKRHVLAAEHKGQKIRFCSKKCKSDNWGKNRIEVSCPTCGKKFLQQARLAKSNLSCSPECAKKNPLNPRRFKGFIEKTCACCGKIFTKRKSYFDKSIAMGTKKFFCSNSCRMRYIREGKQNNKNKDFKDDKILVCCSYCGELTTKNISQLLNKKSVFCSSDCRLNYAKKGTKELICKHCNKSFAATEYQIKHGRKFCSTNCRNEARKIEKETYTTVSHYLRSTKEYSDWRNSVFQRESFTCQDCGTISAKRFHAHHIKTLYSICKQFDFNKESILKSKEFNDINNGMCLCDECHIKRHPYDNRLRDNKGQFCRQEFKVT